jgi:hypothetical protein
MSNLIDLVERHGFGVRVRQWKPEGFPPFAMPFTVVGEVDSLHYRIVLDDGRTGVQDKRFPRVRYVVYTKPYNGPSGSVKKVPVRCETCMQPLPDKQQLVESPTPTPPLLGGVFNLWKKLTSKPWKV